MAKAYYASSIREFLDASTEAIQGRILISDEFRATIEQRNAWISEIEILKDQLALLDEEGSIIFEYTVPRIGSRIDVTCILRGIIFVLEFKVGAIDYLPDDEEQVVVHPHGSHRLQSRDSGRKQLHLPSISNQNHIEENRREHPYTDNPRQR